MIRLLACLALLDQHDEGRFIQQSYHDDRDGKLVKPAPGVQDFGNSP